MSQVQDVSYVPADCALKARIEQEWLSNAGDFISLDEGSFSVVAVAEGIPVGVVSAHRRALAEPLNHLDEVYIGILEVSETCRRAGIGSELVESVIDWARQQSVSQVSSWSLKVRVEALHLWRKLGFTFARIDSPQQMEAPYGFYVTKRI